MSGRISRYACVTPARDEAHNLPRLARALAEQTVPPERWLIVDNGSTDGTAEVVRRLAQEFPAISLLEVDGDPDPVRGAPIVRALHAGFAAIGSPPPDLVASLDADISMDPGYFERILSRFDGEPRLGIASGTCYEREGGGWAQRFVTGTTVWGASRVYRWPCLQQVLPLDPRLGWDGIDEFKANARGWRTRTFLDLPFYHHRREGERDGARWTARASQGRTAHYMGYRPWYLAVRAFFQARRDPAAVGMVWGYLRAAARREPRCRDAEVVAYVRRQQRLRHIGARAREALGRRDEGGVAR